MKKYICLICAAIFCLPLTVHSAAYKTGDIVDYVLYTDIVAYINDAPIQSYNIGGYTVVVAEDLKDYGFYVDWNEKDKTLSIERRYIKVKYINSEWQGFIPEKNTKKVGERAFPVLYTDIKTYFEGVLIRSHNINGRTIVYMDDIADLCAENYIWSGKESTLKLYHTGLVSKWKWEYSNVDYNSNELSKGFTLEFDNKSTETEVLFELSESFGEYGAVDGVFFNSCGLGFTRYMRATLDEKYQNYLHTNIRYGEREHEDTHERRKELSQVFRVYINGVELCGEMTYSQGNGHSDYYFVYDKPYRLEDIKTVRLEIGYKE